MYTITKQFAFSASHQLSLPYVSKCNQYHGHNYVVELSLRALDLNEQSMVVDYHDLNDFGDYIAEHLDHQDLNKVLDCATTAENIAHHLYRIAWKLWGHLEIVVRVSETPRTWAEYREIR